MRSVFVMETRVRRGAVGCGMVWGPVRHSSYPGETRRNFTEPRHIHHARCPANRYMAHVYVARGYFVPVENESVRRHAADTLPRVIFTRLSTPLLSSTRLVFCACLGLSPRPLAHGTATQSRGQSAGFPSAIQYSAVMGPTPTHSFLMISSHVLVEQVLDQPPSACVTVVQFQWKPYPQSLGEARNRHSGTPWTVVRRGALRLTACGNGPGTPTLISKNQETHMRTAVLH